MSNIVDKRIVQMDFDNKDFERGIANSIKDLDNLEKKLDMKGASNGLEELNKTVEKLGKSVNLLTFRFSAVGETIHDVVKKPLESFKNKVEDVIGTVTKEIKSMSDFGQMSSGMDKYEKKTSAVKTIMSATGKTIAEVSKELDRLNFYTDETSYDFANMVKTIGDFTSNGVNLHDAITQMQGIGSAAALAGAGVADANHAMAGFAKAMGKGFVDRASWQWIQTAKLNTKEFKEQLIEAAVAQGTLKKTTEGLYETLGKKPQTVSFDTFEENLKEKWLTSGVLQEALKEYGDFANKVYEIVQNGEADTASEAIALIGNSMEGVGKKGYEAAQVARTFTDAINSVKDAVSTNWMKSFEIIFGNLEEAEELWTNLANTLWDVFAASGKARNELLQNWKDLGGRTVLLETISKGYQNITRALKPFGDAIDAVFGHKEDTNYLYDMTLRLKDFVDGLMLTDEAINDIRDSMTGFLTLVKFMATKGSGFLGIGTPKVLRSLEVVAALLLKITAAISRYAIAGGLAITSSDKFQTALDIVKIVLLSIVNVFINVVSVIGTFIRKFSEMPVIGEIADFIRSKYSILNKVLVYALNSLVSLIDKITTKLQAFKNSGFGDFFEKLNNVIKAFWDTLTGKRELPKFSDGFGILSQGAEIENISKAAQELTGIQKKFNVLGQVMKFISDLAKRVSGALVNSLQTIGGYVKWIGTALDFLNNYFDVGAIAGGVFYLIMARLMLSIQGFASSLEKGVTTITTSSGKFVDGMTDMIKGAGKSIFGIGTLLANAKTIFYDTLKTFNRAIMGTNIVKISLSISLLVGALLLLSRFPWQELVPAGIAMGIIAGGLIVMSWAMSRFMNSLPNEGGGIKAGAAIGSLLAIAAIVLVFGQTVKMLTDVVGNDLSGTGAMWSAMGAITVFIIEMGLLAYALSKKAPDFKAQLVSIIALTNGIKTMATGVTEIAKTLQSADTESKYKAIETGMQTMMLLVAGLAAVTAIAGSVNINFMKGVSVAIIALGIKSLGLVIAEFCKISAEDMEQCIYLIQTGSIFLAGLAGMYMFFPPLKLLVDSAVLTIETIGTSFLKFAAALWIIANCDDPAKAAAVALTSMGIMLIHLFALQAGMSLLTIKFGDHNDEVTKALSSLSNALLKIAAACLIFNFVNPVALVEAITTLYALVAAFGLLEIALKKYNISSGIRALGGIDKIGKSLLAVAAACVLFNFVNVDDLLLAAGALTALFTIYGMLSIIANGSSFDGKGLVKMGTSLLLLAVAIDMLLPAVWSLYLFKDQDKLRNVALVLSGLVVVFGVFAALSSNAGGIKAAPFITLTIAIGAIGTALYALSKLPFGNVVSSGVAMALTITTLAGVLDIMDKNMASTMLAYSGAFIVFSAGIAGIALALGQMAGTDWKQLAAASAGISLVLFTLGSMINNLAMYSWMEILPIAGAIGGLTAVVAGLVYCLSLLKGVEWQTVLASVAPIGATLIGIVTTITSLQLIDAQDLLQSAATLTVLIGVMSLLTVSLSTLKGTNWKSILASAGAMAAAIGIITGALIAIDKFANPATLVPSTLALSGLTVVLSGFALSLAQVGKSFSAMNAEQIGKVMLGLNAAITIITAGLIGLTVAIGVLSPALLAATPAIFAIAAAIGVLCLGIEAIIWASGEAAPKFAELVNTICDGVSNLINSVSTLTATLSEAVTNGINVVINALQNLVDMPLSDLAGTLIFLAVSAGAIGVAGVITGGGLSVAAAGIGALGWAMSSAIDPILRVSSAIVGLKDAINYLIGSGGKPSNIVGAMFDSGDIPKNIESFIQQITNAANTSVADSMSSKSSKSAASAATKAMNDTISKDGKAAGNSYGQNVANGAVEGATSALSISKKEVATVKLGLNDSIIDTMAGDTYQLTQNVETLTNNAGTKMANSTDTMVTMVKDKIADVSKDISNTDTQGLWDRLKGGLTGSLDSLKTNISGNIKDMFGGLTSSSTGEGGLLDKIKSAIGLDPNKPVMEQLKLFTKDKFSGLLEDEDGNSLVDSLKEQMKDLSSSGVGDIGGGVGDSLSKSGIGKAVDKKNKELEDLKDAIEEQNTDMEEIDDIFDNDDDDFYYQEEEVEKLVDIMDYASDVVNHFKDNYLILDNTLSDSTAMQMARDDVFALAEALWKENATEEDLAMSEADRLKAIRDNFKNFREQAENAVGGSISLLQKFEVSWDKTLKDMNGSIKSNLDATANYMRMMRLGADFMPIDTYKYFYENGVESIDELMAYMSASSSERSYMDQAFANQKKLTEKNAMELITLYDKSRKASEKRANGIISDEERIAEETASNTAQTMLSLLKQQELYNEIVEQMTSTFQNSMNNVFSSWEKQEDTTYDDMLKLVENQMDLFNLFKDNADLTAQELLENMQSQLQGTEEFSRDVAELQARGLDTGLIQKLVEMGPEGGYEYAKAFLSMTEEELSSANDMYTRSITLQPEVAQRISDSFEHGITNNITDAMDKTFEKLSVFGDRVTELFEKGLDPELIAQIVNMGLDGIDVAEAILDEDDIEAINEKFRNALTITNEKIDEYRAMYHAIGQDLAGEIELGLVEDVSEEMAQRITEAAEDYISPAATATGIGYPRTLAAGIADGTFRAVNASREMAEEVTTTAEEHITPAANQIGINYPKTLGEGITSGTFRAVNASREMANEVLITTDNKFSGNESWSIGYHLCQGIANGIRDGKSLAIQAAIEMAREALEAAEDELDINSPSKEFYRLGYYSDMGMANGIYENMGVVINTTEAMGNNMLDTVRNAMAKMNSIMDSDYNTDIVIRPVVDLSNVEEAFGSLDAYSSRSLAFSAGISRTSNLANLASGSLSRVPANDGSVNSEVSTQYNFTQNNYSPRALSRVEIYRQTNNQFNHFKNTVGRNNLSTEW